MSIRAADNFEADGFRVVFFFLRQISSEWNDKAN